MPTFQLSIEKIISNSFSNLIKLPTTNQVPVKFTPTPSPSELCLHCETFFSFVSLGRISLGSYELKIVELFTSICVEPHGLASLGLIYPLAGNPVAPLGSADSLRELLDLVARHPGHKGIYPRL